MKKNWFNSFTVAVALTLVSLYIYSLNLPFFHLLELKSYDFKVRSRGERPLTGQVVIVAVDEKSLREKGRWPWPRTFMADLTDKISQAGAAVIGFDIFFPEKDRYVPFASVKEAAKKKDLSGINSENFIEWMQEVGDSDRLFAESILRSERTVLGYFVYSEGDRAGGKAEKLTAEEMELLDFSQFPIVQRFDDPANPVPLRRMASVGLSLPEFVNAANSAGYVSFVPEVDGVVRWVPMAMQLGEFLFPPLSLQMLKEATQLPLAVRIAPFGVDGLKLGDNVFPTSETGDFLVNYFGPAFTFTHYSATDVLDGRVGKKELENKIILVGGTAAGIHDIHTSPYGPLYPGVEVHASVIENLIQQDYLLRPEWLRVFDIAMILASGILLGWISTHFKAYAMAVMLVLGVGGYLAFDFYLFTQKGLWINTIYPVFTQIFVYSGITVFKFGFEEREKRFIKGAFSQYLAPAVVNQLMDNPSLLKLGGERKELTSFFSDVAGFSSISEKLSPEDLVILLNDYLTEMTDIIKKYEGTVDKFEGDAIIAFFGAPISHKDHARRTCMVALEMQDRLAQLREGWKKEGKAELYMRIGINTGPAVVGNMGSLTRMDYTMMGDSVNLAARLEGVNKQYKTETMISGFTYAQVEEFVEVRELDLIRVVGKTEPVKIYELLAKKDGIDVNQEQVLECYNKGYSLYRVRKWNEAAEWFEKALAFDESDGPSLTFFERCITFQIHPPREDWDGVFSFGVK
ncbi:MAG: CHASE2 domain-containing protein [Gammaproteobacteria bacterium]|nr:CHASE2 domain-containing protein [Gammaproteobacteria bacterium]